MIKQTPDRICFMYLLSGFLLLLCIAFFFMNHHRKKCIIQKICHMDTCEKAGVLNGLSEPLGFSYLCQDDILTSVLDAPQREFGYRAVFDRSAPHFHMVFDCEPIYFSYGEQTWLIEFWKGQYGINVGGEIGVYRADTLVSPENRSSAVFHSVPDEKLLPLSMELFCGQKRLFALRERHWWLAGFRMGGFAAPEELTMNCSVTFPNRCMMQRFVEGMMEAGYAGCELYISGLTAAFQFSKPRTRQPAIRHRMLTRWVLWKNRLFCRIYCWMTRPFSCTLDKLLYLYYFLPAACRRMLRLRRVPVR